MLSSQKERLVSLFIELHILLTHLTPAAACGCLRLEGSAASLHAAKRLFLVIHRRLLLPDFHNVF